MNGAAMNGGGRRLLVRTVSEKEKDEMRTIRVGLTAMTLGGRLIRAGEERAKARGLYVVPEAIVWQRQTCGSS